MGHLTVLNRLLTNRDEVFLRETVNGNYYTFVVKNSNFRSERMDGCTKLTILQNLAQDDEIKVVSLFKFRQVIRLQTISQVMVVEIVLFTYRHKLLNGWSSDIQPLELTLRRVNFFEGQTWG